MAREDLIFRNPLRIVGGDSITILPEGGLGAVVARAGVGKTSLLVQIALERMLNEKGALHVSLGDPLDKVCLWYDEVINGLGSIYDKKTIKELWSEIRRHRMIMTFNIDSFSVPKFEERLKDFIDQNIFTPQIVLLDGLSFGTEDTEAKVNTLKQLKAIAEKFKLRFWFTVLSHRHQEKDSTDDIPVPLYQLTDFFETIISLQPQGKDLYLHLVKGGNNKTSQLVLDPLTMLIKSSGIE